MNGSYYNEQTVFNLDTFYAFSLNQFVDKLCDLPNIGNKLETQLNKIGIENIE